MYPKMLTRRELLRVASLGGLAVVASACKPQVVEKTVEVPVEKTVVVEKTVEVQVTPSPRSPVTVKWMDFSQEKVALYNEAEEVLREEYPWINLETETLAQDDYDQTLPLMFSGGNSPDIFVYYADRGSYFQTIELLDLGWIQPLVEEALPADYADRFPNTYKLMEPIFGLDGKLYGVPGPPSFSPYGHGYMWCNPALFEEAGLDPESDIPETWGQLREVCRKIRASGSYGLTTPVSDPGQLHRLFIPLSAVNACGWTDPDTGLFGASSPRTVETVEFLRQLYAEDLVFPGNNSKEVCRGAIAAGQAAIYFDGGWMASVFPTSYGFSDVLAAAPPAPDESGYKGKITGGLDDANHFISNQCQHPYEATLVFEWMTRPNGWYTTQYLSRGLGYLAWGDNERYITDPLLKSLFPVDEKMRVIGPNDLLKCPDLAKSQAMAEANNYHPNWQWEAWSEYLFNGGDWMAVAKEIDEMLNGILLAKLEEEQKAGLNVSLECFTNPGWDRLTNFDYSVYFE